ncbi:classical arabinogalactan protein 26-like [Humulus lupulus]|uniref:classical arabinogalactan protein 26-like n=1 Tax=Humulus lupulus TaxID=3486 RepID=UPI002B40246F|nr:classical arabinogalactan protein 26-like [Humulus lupulus]
MIFIIIIIRMASSFWFHLVLIMAIFSVSPMLSHSSQLSSQPSTLLPSPPSFPSNQPSSFQQLSPDITPLLPSPGGILPTPTVSSVPTIPSNPSPPNPDELAATAAGPAFSPFGPMPVSTAGATATFAWPPSLAAFSGFAACVWLYATPLDVIF